jgi:hypothetical protein
MEWRSHLGRSLVGPVPSCQCPPLIATQTSSREARVSITPFICSSGYSRPMYIAAALTWVVYDVCLSLDREARHDFYTVSDLQELHQIQSVWRCAKHYDTDCREFGITERRGLCPKSSFSSVVITPLLHSGESICSRVAPNSELSPTSQLLSYGS